MEDGKIEAAAPKPADTATTAATATATASAPAPAPQRAPTAGPVTSSSSSSPSPSPSEKPRPSPPASLNIDKTQPQDFDGQLLTTNKLPSADILKKIENYLVLDGHGKTRTFKSLYSGRNVARRVLVIFVRHFFCGNCQEYLRTLSESVTPEALLRLPISTFITVVGCGDPALIDMYVSETKCPFPVYTDPTRSLFDALGLVKTLSLGAKPAYARKSFSKNILDSVVQSLKFVPKGLALKSGDHRQVGGEFLFEPPHMSTPVTTPQDEHHPIIGSLDGRGHGDENDDDARVEEKNVTWCHRMKTTRDHAEMPELMEVLGLDGQGQPIKDEKRWSEALRTRKGTGLSMASQMSLLSEAAQQEQQQEQQQQADGPVASGSK